MNQQQQESLAKPRSRFLTCANRNIHFVEWGSPERGAVIIWHGIGGTARDHDDLAAVLAPHYYVICPDSVGCGLSEWPRDPVLDLVMDFQIQIAQELLAQLEIRSVRWLGASRGGALGMCFAASGNRLDCHVSHLVLNDSGPSLPVKFRQLLASSMEEYPVFTNLLDFEAHLRKTLSRDGVELTDASWRKLSQNWSRLTDHNQYRYHYAPSLMNQVLYHDKDFELWDSYDCIEAKTLLIHGVDSMILSDQQVQLMQQRGPKCQLLSRQGGHTSFFHTPEEQEAVIKMLHN